ncbi:uncharacterized protein At1g76070-like [Durio zibethinus]|uniref:Uncharacterized protein At1g76070-like n=1 Tax=Durio zibethinus TaxID=66656 RepID=A0A6P6B4N2_DURZI|nr:uncharacterized protein At1g76070-like [Durio zibethinus]
MEKQAKPKNKILKFLPKAASAVSVTFHNPPFSPGRDMRVDNYTGKHKAYAGRGFSGPIISIIPDEARRRSKSEAFDQTQEPTSPKVSCMGQIKRNKNMKKAKLVSPPKGLKPVCDQSSSSREVKKNASKLRRIFRMAKPARKSDVTSNRTELPDRAPSLGQMNRFAGGRDAFANFDWMDQMTPVEADHRDYYSDEDRRDGDFEEEETIIPFSAPMTVGGVPLQPRKEINLWKRRTMNPPSPLRLNSMVSAN